MSHDLLALLHELLAVQESILPLLRFHRPSIPKFEHAVVGLVALLQWPAGPRRKDCVISYSSLMFAGCSTSTQPIQAPTEAPASVVS